MRHIWCLWQTDRFSGRTGAMQNHSYRWCDGSAVFPLSSCLQWDFSQFSWFPCARFEGSSPIHLSLSFAALVSSDTSHVHFLTYSPPSLKPLQHAHWPFCTTVLIISIPTVRSLCVFTSPRSTAPLPLEALACVHEQYGGLPDKEEGGLDHTQVLWGLRTCFSVLDWAQRLLQESRANGVVL